MEVSGETQAAKVVAIPRDHDVLFGRGKGVQFHKGNLRLRVVIEGVLRVVFLVPPLAAFEPESCTCAF